MGLAFFVGGIYSAQANILFAIILFVLSCVRILLSVVPFNKVISSYNKYMYIVIGIIAFVSSVIFNINQLLDVVRMKEILFLHYMLADLFSIVVIMILYYKNGGKRAQSN